jgi:hypothetical protein
MFRAPSAPKYAPAPRYLEGLQAEEAALAAEALGLHQRQQQLRLRQGSLGSIGPASSLSGSPRSRYTLENVTGLDAIRTMPAFPRRNMAEDELEEDAQEPDFFDPSERCSPPLLLRDDDDEPSDTELLTMQALATEADNPNMPLADLNRLESVRTIDALADEAVASLLGRAGDRGVQDVFTRYEAWADRYKLPPSADRYSEKAVIAFYKDEYFGKRAPSTFFPHLSNLQAALITLYPEIQFKNYSMLRRLFRKQLDGYLTNKARPLEAAHIEDICKIEPREPRLAMTIATMVVGWYGQMRPVELVRLRQGDVELITAGPSAGGFKICALRRKTGLIPNHFIVPPGPAAEALKRWFKHLPADQDSPLFVAVKGRNALDFSKSAPPSLLNKSVKFMFECFWKKDATGMTGYSVRRGSVTHMADNPRMATHDIEAAAGWCRGSRQLPQYRQTSVHQLANKAAALSAPGGFAALPATEPAALLPPAPATLVPPPAPAVSAALLPELPAGASATAVAAVRRARATLAKALERATAEAASAAALAAAPSPDPTVPLSGRRASSAAAAAAGVAKRPRR